MTKKTIAKISVFVILALLPAALTSACSRPAIGEKPAADNASYEKPKTVGTFQDPRIRESSGIAASPCQTDVYWTHNDSGDGPQIFASDLRGRSLGSWQVAKAKNVDWEDIAAAKEADGRCFLYIGEIGNNKGERAEGAIYRVAEPAAGGSGGETEAASVMRFRYPDGPHNAETLLVNPDSGLIYILTKRSDAPSTIYRLPMNFDSPAAVTAEKIGELSVPSVPNGLLTGGSISPDHKRVMVCDYTQGYELNLPFGSTNFEDIFKQKPVIVNLGDRKQGEAVTYTADGQAVVATSEKKDSPLIEVKRID